MSCMLVTFPASGSVSFDTTNTNLNLYRNHFLGQMYWLFYRRHHHHLFNCTDCFRQILFLMALSLAWLLRFVSSVEYDQYHTPCRIFMYILVLTSPSAE